jgi:hypothetical protein
VTDAYSGRRTAAWRGSAVDADVDTGHEAGPRLARKAHHLGDLVRVRDPAGGVHAAPLPERGFDRVGVPSEKSRAEVRSIAVSTDPGQTALTRTPTTASSTAIARTRASRAPFVGGVRDDAFLRRVTLDRGDDHDRAPAARAQMRDRGMRRQEHALHVDREDLVPCRFVRVGDVP